MVRHLFREQELLKEHKKRTQGEGDEDILTSDIDSTPKKGTKENIEEEGRENLTPIQKELQSAEFKEYDIAQEEEGNEIIEIGIINDTPKRGAKEEIETGKRVGLTPIQKGLQSAQTKENEIEQEQKEKEIIETEQDRRNRKNRARRKKYTRR